jgi:hypothetical protein
VIVINVFFNFYAGLKCIKRTYKEGEGTMEYKLRLIIIGVALFCLLLAGVTQATVLKKCFIDGNDVAQQEAGRALSYDFDRLTIASNGSLTGRYGGLSGTIDEFAIYEGVLPDPCIVAHANSLPANYVATVMADSPVLYLRFEDPCSYRGYTAADSSGNNQHGTYIGDDTVGDVSLVAGFILGTTAAEFYIDAVNDNATCIDVNDAAGALEMNDLTVEFWFKSTTLYDEGAYPVFFTHNGGHATKKGYGGGISFQIPQNPPNPDNPIFALTGGGTTEYDPVGHKIDDGEWHHIVFTYDSTPDPNYEGLGTYAAEVKKDDPVLYLRCESLPLVDDSNNNYWVDAASAVTVQKVTGSMGNCALLSDGWIAAANQQTAPVSSDPCYGPEYAFGDGNSITVEMWCYYPPGTSLATWAGLWNQNDKTDIALWSPGCQTGGMGGDRKCRMRCNERRTPPGDGLAYTNVGTWSTDANNWHHHVMIYDCCDSPATLHVEWWSDGVQFKSSTYNPTTFQNRIGPVRDHILFGNIGNRVSPGNGAYTPYMDEIAVYDYALSSQRIGAHYRAFGPKDCNEVWDRGIFFDDEEVETGVYIPIENTTFGTIDRVRDCAIDFYDFAELAMDWYLCNKPSTAGCTPNWPQ